MSALVPAAPGTHVWTKDGQRLVVAWDEYGHPVIAQADTSVVHIIQAAPGWFALLAVLDGEDVIVNRVPIIAWKILEETVEAGNGGWTTGADVHAITDAGYLGARYATLSPNGAVSNLEGKRWQSVAAWTAGLSFPKAPAS